MSKKTVAAIEEQQGKKIPTYEQSQHGNISVSYGKESKNESSQPTSSQPWAKEANKTALQIGVISIFIVLPLVYALFTSWEKKSGERKESKKDDD